MNKKRDNTSNLNSLKRRIIPILKKNDIVKAGIFGSFARGDYKRNSDIDILVKFNGRKSYFDLAALEMQLEKNIGKKIDLVTYDSINPLLKKSIFKDEVRIL